MSYSFQLAARELFNFFITANSCNKAPINQKKQQGLFYIYHPTDRITHTTAFVTPDVEHWLEIEISSMGPPRGIDPMTYRTTSYSSTMELCVHSTFCNVHLLQWVCETSRALAGKRN